MFCTKCGSKILDENKFCTQCGQLSPLFRINNSVPKSSPSKIDFSPIISFVSKYKFVLMGVTFSLIIIYLIYFFFFKPDPTKLANELIKTNCDCYQKYEEAILTVEKEFNQNFKIEKYKNRAEAEHALTELTEAEGVNMGNCRKEINTKVNEYKLKFNGNYKDSMIFENLLSNLLNPCATDSSSSATKVLDEIHSKINTIKDPEPDVDKLKADLIGKELPGWKFSFLSEIQSLTINNKTRNGNYIELQCDITTTNDDGKETHVYQNVLVNYLLNDEGSWVIQTIACNTFAYNIQVVNTWKKVNIPGAVSYTINTFGKKGWVKEDSWYPQNYKIGPDGETTNLHTNVIYLASRESNEEIVITLNFTKSN